MAKLSPVFNDQTFTADGNPAVGYKLFAYDAGSSTKQTTYSNSAGTVQNSNPIIINNDGYPTQGPIWLTEGRATKFVLALPTDTDPPTSPVKTFDNITGIGDNTVLVSQWVSSGITPTYISPISFSIPGDQTSEFHAGRAIQLVVGSGTVYGWITSSIFSTLTTVTLRMQTGQVLDANLSVANLSILRSDQPATPAVYNEALEVVVSDPTNSRIWGSNGNSISLTGSAVITNFPAAPQPGTKRWLRSTGVTFTNNANISVQGGADYVTVAGDIVLIEAITTSTFKATVFRQDGRGFGQVKSPQVRQTVVSGPVDANGYSAFGGATGATSVTMSGTIRVTAANGFDALGSVDRYGSGTNLQWTGLNTNGVMQLHVIVNADGTLTPVARTLLTNYRQAGADVVTNGQHTFNIKEMVGKIGNGTTASQVYEVSVGEVTVSGGVVTAIRWYALGGYYYKLDVANTLFGATFSHLLGCDPQDYSINIYCYVADQNYLPEDRVPVGDTCASAGPAVKIQTQFCNKTSIGTSTWTTSGIALYNKSSGAFVSITNARWGVEYIANRGW